MIFWFVLYQDKMNRNKKINPASAGINYIYNMQIPKGKKIYFASDNHLGAPTKETSAPREKKFVAWLDEIKQDAAAKRFYQNLR